MAIFGSNGYSGDYSDIFRTHYDKILVIVAQIKEAFSDGFQLKDIPDVVKAAAPYTLTLYRDVRPILKNDAEAEKFLSDLVKFIYYEIEPKLKVNWVVRFVIKTFLLSYAADKIAKYVRIGFDWVDGRIEQIEGYLDFLPPDVRDSVTLIYNVVK